jgi:UDP-N-acetylmuramoyl-tripeptide--D-alanyl-D-alanine ligase
MEVVRLSASAVATVVGGTLHGPDVEVDGAAIDSRVLRPGQLFVPVVAERDGHDFIDHARTAGAAAYLTARPPAGGTAIAVADTAAALAALGRWARDRLAGPVVGITGSAGKTSTKDLLGAVLREEWPTAVSERSFNNELGLPLTLFNAEDGTHAAVLEMGARGFGHISWLCELARPTIGVVTNVAAAHTEMFGSLDGVAKAKSELVAALPASGTAVLNADDERVMAMAARTPARVVTFGVERGDVRVVDPTLDDELRVSFALETPWGRADVALESARGLHQAANAAAAVAAAVAAGVSLEDAVSRLKSARLSPWRMEVKRTGGGALVINDAYNANPASMAEALKALAATRAKRRIAVVGPMLELGDLSDAEHRRMGDLARSLEIRLIAVAAPAYGAEAVDTVDEALELVGRLTSDDAVLVKASRAAGLERAAEALGAAW